MSIFKDEMLPGVITEIKTDYASNYDTSKFGTTDSVVVMGTAFDGPVGVPVKVWTPEYGKYVFGKTYDFKTRREATLVAEIQNAWDRGCRTIYAVRVSGKAIHKDFKLKANEDLKLRVEGIFPNNKNKDVFFNLDKVGNSHQIKIYKPAERATIEEKMQGKVMKENSILVEKIDLRGNWNIGEESRLVDFIDLFNNHKANNVLKLSIVNANGDAVSETPEAQGLDFSEMLKGLYLIGRDKNFIEVESQVGHIIAKASSEYGYDAGAKDVTEFRIECNSDVTKDYPIYISKSDFRKLAMNIAISIDNDMKFLEVPGKIDLLWGKDGIDYEEVRMDSFELYKKLGSGFANTAKIEETRPKSGVYKVVEVISNNDENRIVPIREGIYSVLENLKTKYRVLTCASIDDEIKGAMPKKAEFLISSAKSNKIINDSMVATAKIDPKDLSAAKEYEVVLEKLDAKSDVFTTDVADMFSELKTSSHVSSSIYALLAATGATKETFNAKNVEDGTYVVIGNELCQVNKKTVKSIVCSSEYRTAIAGGKVFKLISTGIKTEATEVKNFSDVNKYMIADVNSKSVLFEVQSKDTAITGISAIGYTNDFLRGAEDTFIVVIPSIKEDKVINTIQISSSIFDNITVEELSEVLNNDKTLSTLFNFEAEEEVKENIILGEIVLDKGDSSILGINKVLFEDRNAAGYDLNLYIPFRTNDNFGRQIAQHAMYTSLKTTPTHAVIGCKKLMSSNLKSIADRVSGLLEKDFSLYAKRPNGNDMLDRNNMPHPLGRCLSVVFFQNEVATGDNYTFISSGAAAYAGMLSRLPIDTSSTNQPINVNDYTFELNNYQIQRLTQMGFVTIKNSYTEGYVITDGVTMAPITSPFRRLSVSRVINAVDDAIRAASEPFIGKQNSLAARNSLQTAIKSKLDLMTGKLIEKYNFRLVPDKAAERLGIINVQYNIVPIYEIKEIRNTITVKENQ